MEKNTEKLLEEIVPSGSLNATISQIMGTVGTVVSITLQNAKSTKSIFFGKTELSFNIINGQTITVCLSPLQPGQQIISVIQGDKKIPIPLDVCFFFFSPPVLVGSLNNGYPTCAPHNGDARIPFAPIINSSMCDDDTASKPNTIVRVTLLLDSRITSFNPNGPGLEGSLQFWVPTQFTVKNENVSYTCATNPGITKFSNDPKKEDWLGTFCIQYFLDSDIPSPGTNVWYMEFNFESLKVFPPVNKPGQLRAYLQNKDPETSAGTVTTVQN